MAFEIHMPKLSDTMEEGTVIRWIVKSGQSVAAGDAIAEVETDKADVEIEAERSGVVREIVVPEGSAAAVGALIAVLEDGAAEAPSEAASTPAPVVEPAVAVESGGDAGAPEQVVETSARAADRSGSKNDSETGSERPPAAAPPQAAPVSRVVSDAAAGSKPLSTPVAREVAARSGIDLSRLSGSGPGGRIVKSDVEAALAVKERSGEAPSPAALDRSSAASSVAGSEPASKAPEVGAGETMSRMRRTIAARMEKSKREIPHFYIRAEVDVGELVKLYETVRSDELIPGLTVTHLLLRAIGLSLPHHPRLNALWVEDSIEIVPDVNIGIVVGLDDGLMVPVVKRVQTLGLRVLVEESRALVERTRKGKFRSDDLVGGTISVSNIGMLDVAELTPIINAPQACILGVGAMRECALVRDGQVVAGRAMTLTLACDHRVVNGVEAGRFLEELKASLEKPLALVVDRA